MTSSRFEELERRCIKLKKARVMRIVFSIGLLFLGTFGTYYWFYHFDVPSSQITLIPTQAMAENSVIIDKNESNTTVADTNDTNKSTLTTIEESQDSNATTHEDLLFLEPHIYKGEAKLPTAEAQEAKRSLAEEQQLLSTFKEEHNFTNAYALAYFYYKRKAYSEAITWAKETSKYNSSSEKPWILYAKAKFRIGEIDEAIRSLELFLSYIKSQEAQDLLIFYKGQK